MPFQTQWYIPNEVAFTRYWGELSADDVAQNIKALYQLVDQSDRFLVHSITDVSAVTHQISFVETLKTVSKSQNHPRAGWILSYGEKDVLMRFIASASSQVLHLRVRVFNNLQECLDFLKRVDNALHWADADPTIVAAENETYGGN